MITKEKICGLFDHIAIYRIIDFLAILMYVPYRIHLLIKKGE